MRVRWWVVVALVLGGCGNPNGPNNTIQVLDNAFSPATLTVPPGTTVYWVWGGSAPHNVVFNQAAGGPNSETQTSGQFERAFPSAGTFSYTCTVHLGMDGSIVVR